MALVVIPDENRMALETNGRFRNLVQIAAFNKAAYWRGLNGTSVPGSDYLRWAKSRFLSYTMIFNPDSVAANLENWVKPFSILLKTQAVYDNAVAYNADTVMNYMIANSKFDEVMDQVFDLKITAIDL